MKNIIPIAATLLSLTCLPAATQAQFSVAVGVSIRVPPPVLPVYVQPPCPVEGYLWCPGYWAYGPDGYYWVPGVWVAPPEPGLLWTPGYWGCVGGVYGWHAGYWGPHVGFYGGVDYGFGYGGVGFHGGEWRGGVFRYNTAVVRVNRSVIHHTYVDRTVFRHTGSRASFNGPGGVSARPTAADEAAMRDRHMAPTSAQFAHNRAAREDRNAWASNNAHNGRPVARPSNLRPAMRRAAPRPAGGHGVPRPEHRGGR